MTPPPVFGTSALRQYPGLRRFFLDDQRAILVIELCRGEKRNALNLPFWQNYPRCFPRPASSSRLLLAATAAGQEQQQEEEEQREEEALEGVRVVVVCAEGPAFTSGLDVSDPAMMGAIGGAIDGRGTADPARIALRQRRHVAGMQAALSAAEACPVPVIAAVHGACIGAGLDLITAADVRLCSADAYFSVREVRLGIAADVGTLQRLPKVAANESLIRELAFTGKDFGAGEAAALGLFSRVVESDGGGRSGGSGGEAVRAAAFALARDIAAQSPVAVVATKANLLYSRDHSVADGLDYVATWNAAALQSEDLKVAAAAASAAAKKRSESSDKNNQKVPPLFSKL